MKTLVIFCLTITASCSCFAQATDQPARAKGYDPRQSNQQQQLNPEPIAAIYRSKEMPVLQSIGKTFNAETITQMARRDVNGIASTVAGVESRPGTGETPSIRGAGAAGTAYFVDGVRVYGALPLITK